MLNLEEPVTQKDLGDGLTLRSVSTMAELDQIAAMNAVVFEPGVGEMTRKIFATHPHVTGRDLVYIANEAGETIASLCLIPWALCFGGVELPAAELGIVGTLEHYRGRGLNRLLMGYFWQRYQERGALLSIIEGIPYFYRQYGYEYAMLPLEGGWRIQPDQIPAPVATGYTVRPASGADIPTLAGMYDAQAALYDLSSRRGEEIWRFLLERTPEPEGMQHDTFLVEAPDGRLVSYFRVPDFHFHMNLLTVDDAGGMDFIAGMAVLDHLKKMVGERGKDGIRLLLPQNNGLLRLARSFGAVDMGAYSWQVSIPDRAAFLTRLAPVLQKRLAGSLFAGLSGEYALNLYKESIGLTFSDGRLEAVGKAGKHAQVILSVPPNQFITLAVGGRKMADIHAAFPDAFAHEPWQLLVDTLFPPVSSWLATVY